MEIQNVRYFLALFEEENFSRAAKRCGVAQPSLSNAIKRLEEHVGGLLFERRPHVHPSPLADALKPYFEQILVSVQLAQQEARRLTAAVAPVTDTASGKTRSCARTADGPSQDSTPAAPTHRPSLHQL
jgi:DNA-binding transcriptional LysR family regulator